MIGGCPIVEAGTPPSVELELAVVDVGGAALRFGEVAHRAGTIAIRSRDAASPLEVNATWEAATRTLVLRNAPTNSLVIRESPSCTQ